MNDVAGVGALQAGVLRDAGYTVDFIDLPKPGATWPLYAKLLALPLRMVLYLPIVWRLRHTPYAWLHIHFLSYGVLGILAGKPYYVHGHGHDVHTSLAKPVLGWISRLGMRHAQAVFYVTPDLAKFLGDFRDKAHLLPNPLEPSFFVNVQSPHDIERVLVFTRLYPIKGPEDVFAATPELSKEVKVAAIAWGPLAADYHDRYGRYVEFLDKVPHPEVPALLDRFEAVIGQMKLGILSLSELEGMARGRVVMMRLDRSLYPNDPPPVVQVDDAASLVSAVHSLRQNPDEVTRLSVAGRDWIARHHTSESHLSVLKAVFRQTMSTAPPRAGDVALPTRAQGHDS